jgi:hypothetical protein
MFNAPPPRREEEPDKPLSHSHSHLAEAKDKINALKAGERLTLEIDPLCFNDIWVAYENERRNHRQGGLGKLKMDYNSVSEVMTVRNVEKKEPAPAPAPEPVKPDPPVFPRPDEW